MIKNSYKQAIELLNELLENDLGPQPKIYLLIAIAHRKDRRIKDGINIVNSHIDFANTKS